MTRWRVGFSPPRRPPRGRPAQGRRREATAESGRDRCDPQRRCSGGMNPPTHARLRHEVAARDARASASRGCTSSDGWSIRQPSRFDRLRMSDVRAPMSRPRGSSRRRLCKETSQAGAQPATARPRLRRVAQRALRRSAAVRLTDHPSSTCRRDSIAGIHPSVHPLTCAKLFRTLSHQHFAQPDSSRARSNRSARHRPRSVHLIFPIHSTASSLRRASMP